MTFTGSVGGYIGYGIKDVTMTYIHTLPADILLYHNKSPLGNWLTSQRFPLKAEINKLFAQTTLMLIPYKSCFHHVILFHQVVFAEN